MRRLRKLLSIFVTLIMIVCSTLVYSCITYASTDSIVPSSEFSNNNEVIVDFFAAPIKYVTNTFGDDVSESFFRRANSLYEEGNIVDIKRIIADEKLSLHVVNAQMQPYAYEQSKSVASDYIYQILRDTNDATTMEIQVELTGTIWYNPNTYQVTSVSNTSLRVHVMTSSAFGSISRHYDDRTNSSVKSGMGYFWASSHFAAQARDGSVTYFYDYGTSSFEFYASA